MVVIAARRRGTVITGAFAALLAAGLAASLAAQRTVSGKITAAVFFGLFIALCAGLWLLANQGRGRIEVTANAITHRHGRRASSTSVTISRRGNAAEPADLRLIPRLRDHGYKEGPRLTIVGSGGWISLIGFSERAVQRGCERAGWRFGNGTPAQAAYDLRNWYESGRIVESAQLVTLFGPYDWHASTDGTTSLGAAVLEAYADRLAEIDIPAARVAYLRAAEAQRSYAASATSGGEGSARMAEAERLTVKANS